MVLRDGDFGRQLGHKGTSQMGLMRLYEGPHRAFLRSPQWKDTAGR